MKKSPISLVGLGPAGLSGTSNRALQALQSADKVYVRTQHHPAVTELSDRGIAFESFDYLYETCDSFDEVYQSIAERILTEGAAAHVAYAVPGHPLVGETAVEIIIRRAKEAGLCIEMVPSPSFIEACLEALQVSLDEGLKILDALQIERLTPSLDTANLIYQVYDRETASRVKLRLMEFLPDEFDVFIISGAGTDDVKVFRAPLYKLDRQEVDHLTTIYVPRKAEET